MESNAESFAHVKNRKVVKRPKPYDKKISKQMPIDDHLQSNGQNALHTSAVESNRMFQVKWNYY